MLWSPGLPTSTFAARARRVAPWLVAALTLGWLFSRIPFAELRASLAQAPIGPFIGLIVLLVGVTLLSDTFATWATFKSSLPEAGLTFRETLNVRGASYLLALIHYGAGQGGIAYFVSRKHGVPLARAAGAVMLIMGVNVIVVALLALLGVLLGGAPSAPALRWIVLGLACAFPGYLGVIALRPGFLTRLRLLEPLFRAGLRGHAVAVAARLPHIAVLVVGQFVALRMWDIGVPFTRALALLPLVFVVAVLPISPGGIGTAQATQVALFWTWASGATDESKKAAVLACGLAIQVLSMMVQASVGLVFTRHVTLSSRDKGPGEA